jgi:membrane fusion protein, heavy metal efflux system
MKWGGGLAVAAAVLIVILWVGPFLRQRISNEEVATPDPQHGAELVPGHQDAIRLAPGVAERLGVLTEAARILRVPTVLELSGTLMLDANRMSHIHARFAGEVVEIGPAASHGRPLDLGDEVHAGQFMAAIWSRELGEKKSELVDSLSQLRLDQVTLKRLKDVTVDGAVPERSLREAERKVQSDEIAVGCAVRTLQTWRVPKEEIDTVYAEAEHVHETDPRTRGELVRQWARSELRAPHDGIVLERNVAPGDLVDTNADLFKTADLRQLRVIAQAYEEQLPLLDALDPAQRRWNVTIDSDPQAGTNTGAFDQIGRIIDPNQHTVSVMGWVENPRGRLRAGQFVTAHIELPPPPHEVAVPSSALLDYGQQQFVFVRPSPRESCFVRRQVAVSRRMGGQVFLRTELSTDEMSRGVQPVAEGERVVVSGTVELAGALADLGATAVGENK